MRTIRLIYSLLLAAISLPALSLHAQSGGYPYYYPYSTGPLGSFYTSNSYMRIQVPLERVGHSFSVTWRTTVDGATTTASLYTAALITTSGTGGEYTPLQSVLLFTYAPSPTYTYANGTYTYNYFTAFEWWVTDITAGQKSQIVLGTPGAYDGTPGKCSGILNGPWKQLPNTGVGNGYFAIPDTRAGHSLGLRDGGAWVTISPGSTLYTYSSGTSGATVPLHWVVGTATGGVNSATAYLGDINTGDRTQAGVSDVRASTAWTSDSTYAFYPLLNMGLTLDAREAGHRFAVHSKASVAPEMTKVFTAVAGTGNARLDFSVGKGVRFWITREAEMGQSTPPTAPAGASVSSGGWVATTNGTTFSAISPDPNLFPAPPLRPVALVTKQFRVNALARPNRSFTVRMSDGYSTLINSGPAHLDVPTNTWIAGYGTGSTSDWSALGASQPVPIYTFSAQIDPRFSTVLRDETTLEEIPVRLADSFTDWLSPWLPTGAYSPAGPTITLNLPATRYDHPSYRFARPDLASPNPFNPANSLTYTMLGLASTGSSNPTPLPPHPAALPPLVLDGIPQGSPIPAYGFNVFSVTLVNPTPDVAGSFPLVDLLSGDPTPFYVSAGINDLRTWFTAPVAKTLQISTSRWDHVLRLRQPNGESNPITRDQDLGFVEQDSQGNSYPHPYYLFRATSEARPDLPWYIEDLSTDPVQTIGPTGNNLGPTNDELIVWYDLPTPIGLTGVLSVGLRRVELVWSPNGASHGGAFTIERKFGGATWGTIATLSYTDYLTQQQTNDGLIHVADAIPSVGLVPSYRVRYTFGAEGIPSAASNIVTITGWQDSDNDGLPDAWEMANFGSLNEDAAGNKDGDTVDGLPTGTPYTNGAEFANHTNPNALPAGAPGSTLIVYTPLQ